MKKNSLTITSIAIFCFGFSVSTPGFSQGFLKGLFKKNEKSAEEIATVNAPGGGNPRNPRTVLTANQLSAQEAAAQQALAAAQAQESAGNYGRANSSYKAIVKKYPRTRSAAESQYRMGVTLEADGKRKKAFEEYQKLISVYKNSGRYTEAMNRQYAIAEGLRNSGKNGKLGGIGAEVQPSKLIEMFQQISDNAPYTEFAPRSLLNIGYIYANQGQKQEAIMAFQSVADNYQQHEKFASEAQFQVFQLRGDVAEKSFSPSEDRAQVEAGLDFVSRNPSDPRAADVKAQMGAIEDRKLEKHFNVARYYESQNKPQSAAVYYREIVKFPGASRYEDARKRLAAIEAGNPAIAAESARRSTAGFGGFFNRKSNQPEAAPALPGEEPAGGGGGNGGLKNLFSGIGKKKTAAEEAAYLGPPPPTIETQKPEMRTGNDKLLPIPADNPGL